ncbi:hypothetical protein KIW84_015195 [Lathyrus oleraceus]|uniref:Uncharacterized protein n=1 Tax=Pisum sativum TaxID=3888 RepID=A0A9D5BPN5_PEA|nr:hypothetical protein KIW84_015195 [Pisum sativum]
MIIFYTHQGKFEKARKFLELAPDKLDIACWNAMIVGYAKKEWENEFGNAVFREDGGEKCCFLEFSYYSACVNLAALQMLGTNCEVKSISRYASFKARRLGGIAITVILITLIFALFCIDGLAGSNTIPRNSAVPN